MGDIKEYKLLMVEDCESDAELVISMLRKSGMRFQVRRAENSDTFTACLHSFRPDLILSDYNLPSFDGLSALKISKEISPDVPFIIISGAIGEEMAVEILKAGAADYLLKDRLSRLVPAVQSSLSLKKAKEEKRDAEEELKKSYRELEQRVQERTRELQESEEEYRRIIETANEGIVFRGSDGKIHYVNNKMADMLGYPVEELVGRVDLDFMSKDQKEKVLAARAKLSNKTGIQDEFCFLRKDGTLLWTIGSSAPIFDGKGDHIGNLTMHTDITERKRAEEMLSVERYNLQNIFDVINIGLLLTDENGCVKRVNDTAARWREGPRPANGNAQPGDVLGCVHALNDSSGCGHTPHCRECSIRRAFESVLRSGKPKRGMEAAALLLVNGVRTSLCLDVSVDPIVVDGKKHVLIALNNITERKRAEEVIQRDKETLEKLVTERTEALLQTHKELEKARRLSDIGTLAATVAHEMRNPLAAISIASTNIKRKAKGDAVEKHLHTIAKKIVESNQIIDNLLYYSRLRPPEYGTVDMFAILTECIDLAQVQFQAKQSVVNRKFENLKDLPLEADAHQMREVVNNILNNAFDAIPASGGAITVASEADTEYLKIRIVDNGPGIEKGMVHKVFDPFFTTKAKGTGLGLSVCRQIIDLHGGAIDMESEKGNGATVTVTLPLKKKMKWDPKIIPVSGHR